MGLTDDICNCCSAFVEAAQFEASNGYCAECARPAITVTGRITKRAQPMGEYKPTAIDEAKAASDFRILDVGKRFTIAWRDGRRDRVTEKQLARLQAAHTWATDF